MELGGEVTDSRPGSPHDLFLDWIWRVEEKEDSRTSSGLFGLNWVVPFTKLGTPGENRGLGWGGEQELCPGHIQSEMLIKPSCGDIKDIECVCWLRERLGW